MENLEKQIELFMSLPYTMTVKYRPEQGGYYVAGYIELPDLTMTGDTPEEAVRELLEEKPEWFETCLKLGINIPLPIEPQKYSGKFVLRMPPSLHESLIQISDKEGVSLNQYMVAALSKSVWIHEGKESATINVYSCNRAKNHSAKSVCTPGGRVMDSSRVYTSSKKRGISPKREKHKTG
jgi:predicted HicB family RNase H-like nuclease